MDQPVNQSVKSIPCKRCNKNKKILTLIVYEGKNSMMCNQCIKIYQQIKTGDTEDLNKNNEMDQNKGELYKCDCGSIFKFTLPNIFKHMRTKRHMNYMEKIADELSNRKLIPCHNGPDCECGFKHIKQ